MSDLRQLLVRVSTEARAIANHGVAEGGFESLSEYIEWVLLCQKHTLSDSVQLFAMRKKRGGIGGTREAK